MMVLLLSEKLMMIDVMMFLGTVMVVVVVVVELGKPKLGGRPQRQLQRWRNSSSSSRSWSIRERRYTELIVGIVSSTIGIIIRSRRVLIHHHGCRVGSG